MIVFQSLGMIFAVIVQVMSFVGMLAIPGMMLAVIADFKAGKASSLISLRWILLIPVLYGTMFLMMLLANVTTLVEQPLDMVAKFASFGLVVGLMLCLVYFFYREQLIRTHGSGFSATVHLRRVMLRAKWHHLLQYRRVRRALAAQVVGTKEPVSLQKETS